jgi:hypothetical protein
VEITDAVLDAATEAYVKARWPDVQQWRQSFPDAWLEVRGKVQDALVAAIAVWSAPA